MFKFKKWLLDVLVLKKNSNFREFLLNEENWTIATKEDDNDDE